MSHIVCSLPLALRTLLTTQKFPKKFFDKGNSQRNKKIPQQTKTSEIAERISFLHFYPWENREEKEKKRITQRVRNCGLRYILTSV
jgi:hypothetical protein